MLMVRNSYFLRLPNFVSSKQKQLSDMHNNVPKFSQVLTKLLSSEMHIPEEQ